jgi:hypothetical protein
MKLKGSWPSKKLTSKSIFQRKSKSRSIMIRKIPMPLKSPHKMMSQANKKKMSILFSYKNLWSKNEWCKPWGYIRRASWFRQWGQIPSINPSSYPVRDMLLKTVATTNPMAMLLLTTLHLCLRKSHTWLIIIHSVTVRDIEEKIVSSVS